MSKDILTFSFHGIATDNTQMDVLLISKSLRGLEELLISAAIIIYPEEPIDKIQLVGGIESGSFKFSIRVVWRVLDNKSVTRMVNLLTILGFIGINGDGLIEVLKKGPENNSIEYSLIKKVDGVDIVVGTDTIHTNATVIELAKNNKVRNAIDDFTCPVKEIGIDKLVYLKSPSEYEIATKLDIQKLSRENIFLRSDTIQSSESEWVEIISPSFIDGVLWTVKTSAKEKNIVKAKITDSKYLKSIAYKKKTFRKGDMLFVDVIHEEYFNKRSGMERMLNITKVREHLAKEEFKKLDKAGRADLL